MGNKCREVYITDKVIKGGKMKAGLQGNYCKRVTILTLDTGMRELKSEKPRKNGVRVYAQI